MGGDGSWGATRVAEVSSGRYALFLSGTSALVASILSLSHDRHENMEQFDLRAKVILSPVFLIDYRDHLHGCGPL